MGPDDLIFIPQNTIYDRIVASGNRFAAVLIFVPYFNRSKEDIEWNRGKS